MTNPDGGGGGGGTLCETCTTLADARADALTIKSLEIVETAHNACAPITYYTCRCKTCGAGWTALEVFDEDGVRPSEWSWERV